MPESSTDRRATEAPVEVAGLIDRPCHRATSEVAVERGALLAWCAAFENANPLHWDDDVARRVAGGVVAPPTTLSLWLRPLPWHPGAAVRHPLQLHVDVKARLGLPRGIVTATDAVFHRPLRPGDVVTTDQTLRAVGAPRTTRLGTGRAWTIEVRYRDQRGEAAGTETYTAFGYGAEPDPGRTRPPDRAGPPAPDEPHDRADDAPGPAVRSRTLDRAHAGDRLPPIVRPVTGTTVRLGAAAARDWAPVHHDPAAARAAGAADVFLDTPSQQAWIERLVTDWTGPGGRIGRLGLRMHRPVQAGDTMAVAGTVAATAVDARGCGWVTVDAAIAVDDRTCSTARVVVALPRSSDDGPWRRQGDAWRPPGDG